LQGWFEAVQVNSIEATVNSILREWRDLWPGGLRKEEYSTLNLMALCRQSPLGYNHARCQDCRHRELVGAPQSAIGEKSAQRPRPACQKCGGSDWKYKRFKNCPDRPSGADKKILLSFIAQGLNRFSLYPPDSG